MGCSQGYPAAAFYDQLSCPLTALYAHANSSACAPACRVVLTTHFVPPQDFEWSPAEPLLAAYTQEVGDRPANISIVKIPDRTAVRSKQLFNVSGEWCG